MMSEPRQLLRYEFHQRRVVERLLRAKPFDIVHRATPSGYKDLLLRVPSVPLVVGPVLGSEPPPGIVPLDLLAALASCQFFEGAQGQNRARGRSPRVPAILYLGPAE